MPDPRAAPWAVLRGMMSAGIMRLVGLVGVAGIVSMVGMLGFGAPAWAVMTIDPASSITLVPAPTSTHRGPSGPRTSPKAISPAKAPARVDRRASTRHGPMPARHAVAAPRQRQHQGNASEWLGYRSGPPKVSAREANAAPPTLPFYVARRGATTIYVLGTLHGGYPSDYPANHPFRAPILAALNASSVVAFELSPDDLIDAAADVAKVGRCAYACLPQAISPSLLRKVAARVGMNPALLKQVERMRPWLAAMVMQSYDSMSSGMQSDYSSEAQIQNNDMKARIVGLETLREQMNAFDKLSLDQQREMLEQTMAQSPQQNAADLRRLHALWRAGDADRLFVWQARKSAQLARDKKLSDAIDERILYRRNRRFVTRVLALTAPRKPVFMAVGALHLGGQRGVLALLRREGYQVSKR